MTRFQLLYVPAKLSGTGGLSMAPGGMVKLDFGLISLGTGKCKGFSFGADGVFDSPSNLPSVGNLCW